MSDMNNEQQVNMDKEKADLRKIFFQRRREIFHKNLDVAEDTSKAEYLACNNFLDRIPFAEYQVIAGYCPIRTELDPFPLMKELHARSHMVCVPVITEHASPLIFREWSPECKMEEGEFGANVPVDGRWIEPTLLIVPLLAWSNSGERMGYGGGFYDRTLYYLRSRRHVLAVGYAFHGQEVESVPCDQYDQALDFIVSESGVAGFGEYA